MSDRKTISVTPSGDYVLQEIGGGRPFAEQLDAARFACSLAIRDGLAAGEFADGKTKWNVGSFDPNGDIRAAVRILYPDVEEPYSLIEGLVEAGLRYLAEHLRLHGHVDFEVLLGREHMDLSTHRAEGEETRG